MESASSMLPPTGPAVSAASDRSDTHKRDRKGRSSDGNSSEAEIQWYNGGLQKMQHAGPVRAPSPAHGHCTPDSASSKKLEGWAARGFRCLPPPQQSSEQLILAVGPGRGRAQMAASGDGAP
ncbi:hypothetical protein Q7P37_000068 [Cladosporium fusiforme]